MKTVLIIDDNPVITSIIGASLPPGGCTRKWPPTAKQASRCSTAASLTWCWSI